MATPNKKTTNKLYWFPLAVFLIFPLTFMITYTMAVKAGHIYAFFSYISDTGTVSPELCVFALGLNIAAFFLAGVVYIRYCQVEDYFMSSNSYEGKMKRVNFVAAVFGVITVLGVSVVGCFQESNVLSVHLLGAFMAFMGGSIYLMIEAYFSIHMVPIYGTKGMAYFRMFIGAVCAVLFIICYSCGASSMKHFTGDSMLLWRPEDGGWTLRVTSVTTEWIMASLFDIYFFTLVPEFKKIIYTAPEFTCVELAEKHGDKKWMNNTMDEL